MLLSRLISFFNLPVGFWRKLALLSFSIFFISAGIDHFTNKDFYLSIMPPPFPLHLEAVYISGFFEILGGFGLLIPKVRKIAALGLLALLISVYPANIYMAFYPEAFPQYSLNLLYFRLFLQFIAFYWAYSLSTEKFNPTMY
jgi:uncharacterized membrane protein